MRVLHVTECLSAGVWWAIQSRRESVPEVEHTLLTIGRVDADVSDWRRVKCSEGGPWSHVFAIRRCVREWRIDVVHAHSSWAGFYCRVLGAGAPVVYEPHCFKFTDPNVGRCGRLLYRTAEGVLARRTDAFGVLSKDEFDQVVGLGYRGRLVSVPNVPTVGRLSWGGVHPGRVSMVGRICQQKDPLFFVAVVEELRRLWPGVEARWIGDGDQDMSKLLAQAGVEVTGWLSPERVQEQLLGTTYVHSASYEGFPLSVLDAVASGIPVVVRRISALTESGLMSAASAAEMARIVGNIWSGGVDGRKLADRQEFLLHRHSMVGLRGAMLALYEGLSEI